MTPSQAPARPAGPARLLWLRASLGLGLLALVPVLGCPAQPSTTADPRDPPPPAAGSTAKPTPTSTPAASTPDGPRSLTILHTNDWHGYAFAAPDRRTGEMAGGVAAVKAVIDRIRAERPDEVLVLDGGDLLSGHPAVSFVDDGIKGLAFCLLWDQIGFDAWVIGNHELDHGRQNLIDLVNRLKSPALCANWLTSPADGSNAQVLRDATAVPAKPYIVLERAGVRVGIVGLVTGGLPALASRETMAGTRVVHPVDALAAILPRLRAESDVQIALTHCGVEVDERLAREVAGLHAVIGGHSHTFLEPPREVVVEEVVDGVGRDRRIPICQAGQHGRVVGRLDLLIDAQGRVQTWQGQLLPAPEVAPSAMDPALRAAEAALLERVDELERQVIGVSPAYMGRSYFAQSALGGAVAEAFRAAADAEVGLANSGGVRSDMPAGPITMKKLMEIMPFDNDVVRFRLSEPALLHLMRYNARATAYEQHGIVNLAGATCRYRKTVNAKTGEPDVEVVEASVGGAPIDLANPDKSKSYVCATSDYLFEQQRKYLGVRVGEDEVERLGLPVRDALARALAAGALADGPFGVNAEAELAPAAPAGVDR